MHLGVEHPGNAEISREYRKSFMYSIASYLGQRSEVNCTSTQDTKELSVAVNLLVN